MEKNKTKKLTESDLDGMESCYRLGGIDDLDLKDGTAGELLRLARLGLKYEQLVNSPMCRLTKTERSLAIKIAPGALLELKTPDPRPNEVIAHWCDLYKEKYGAVYHVDKKTAGIIAQKCKQLSLRSFSVLFQCYLAIDERLYEEQKHPLSLFFRDIQKINVAAQTRKNPKSEKIDKLFKED